MRLTAASYLRDAAPRSSGGLLFLNTTRATLSTSTQSVSPTNVEIISSAAGGNPAVQPITSETPTTSLTRPGSSSIAVTAPTSPGGLIIVAGSLSSSSTHALEPTSSDALTVVRGSPGLTSSPAAEPVNSGDLTMVQGSSNPGSTPAVGPTSSGDLTTTQGREGLSSTHAAESTTTDNLTTVQGGSGLSSDPAVAPTGVGASTTAQTGPSSSSTYAVRPTTSTDLTATRPTPSLSRSAIAGTASTDLTRASYRPSSAQSESEGRPGPASTTTHKPAPSRSTTSAEIVSTLPTETLADPQPSSASSSLPTALGQATSGAPRSTLTLTLASAPSRTTHSTATHDATSPSRQDRASGSVSTSLPPWTAPTASLPTNASKPQTAVHAVAMDANTAVEVSSPTATSPTPSPDGVLVNIVENSTTVGGTVASQSTSRTSTASAVTLSRGGAAATTILTEAPSPTRDGPPGQVQTPVQGLPRVILPGSSITPSSDGSLIQLGFLFPLNYVFVSQHLQAAAQIFEVLPGALAHGTVQRSAVEVAKLVPYDTQARVGYITTVAKLYYPKAFVGQLQTDILDPKSEIYTTGEDMQRNLTALIDPAIKITDDNGGMDCASQPCNTSRSSSKQTGITAGAVVGGAAVCGVLGLGIFQLYRRRGLALAAAWPSGKQKNRLTGTRISRPIDSVNSLGWNWLTDR
ncbi:Signaling mucin MSB2 [Beauveria bassiana]|uniref:Signaling mucin MSB2 n=1 Tax=Beauveria bassiana TaxID=176275 RepID=A0A2N6NED0_BEABA|nr:Signaling mucin MSB2 [Beauveria bassiana]